jgi:hypothetical protein
MDGVAFCIYIGLRDWEDHGWHWQQMCFRLWSLCSQDYEAYLLCLPAPCSNTKTVIDTPLSCFSYLLF